MHKTGVGRNGRGPDYIPVVLKGQQLGHLGVGDAVQYNSLTPIQNFGPCSLALDVTAFIPTAKFQRDVHLDDRILGTNSDLVKSPLVP